MLLTLQALWILLFSFVGRTFLIKSSLSRMIHSISLKTKFEVLDIPTKILAFRSYHTWYTVAVKLSLREKLTKLLPCQSDRGPSNPFIPALFYSWNVASVTNIPPDRFSIGAFKEQVVVILIVAKIEWASIGTMYTKLMKSILSCEFLLDSHP
jgi:hypothetical protein